MAEDARTTRTTCPYCGVGCGVLASVAADGAVTVRGDPDHPANRGRLCSKGTALAETVGLEGRLLHPEVDGRRVGWGEAVETVAARLGAIVDRHGPDAVAFYLSGQLLTEDYYVANKLMKGFVSSANVDTNSRLCMASTVAGHRRAFGSDTVPASYEDLECADLVVLVGSNLAWCHPVLHQRLQAARAARGTRVVVIDPRRTPTAAEADLHLPLRPGTDSLLFNGLLAQLAAQGRCNPAYVDAHTTGVTAALAAAMAEAPTPQRTATACDLDPAAVAAFFTLFRDTERVVTVFSQGVNQSAKGTDTVNAIVNVHLLTGRIGRPGMGPFSVTGQPNAMGGREVGGLANQLAAHMGFDPVSVNRVRRFWEAPRMATREGLKAVDLFHALDSGAVRAVWILGTNPAVSLPEADRVRRALAKAELVIVSDVEADTDTLRYAHIRLPALAWGEKDGTVTNSDRTISRQRAFLPAPGEARADWWALAAVGRALGWETAFSYDGPAAIFREHARLSAFENEGSRDFDIGAVAALPDAAYDALPPFTWPCPAGAEAPKRLFGNGGFFTPDRRARFVAVTTGAPARPPQEGYPLLLNTGRVRDQWHTMTRTGRSARLCAHAPEPTVSLHPEDAATYGLNDGALARLESPHGTALARVRLDDGQRRGEAFLPMHWNDRYAARAVAGRLIDGLADPLSGQPDLKRMGVRIAPYAALWHGLLVARDAHEPVLDGYWARQRMDGCHAHLLAGDAPCPAPELLVPALAGVQTVEYADAARGVLRRAWFADGRLLAVLFVSPQAILPDRGWLAGLVADGPADADTRGRLLAGRPAAPRPSQGRTVCVCFGVGVDGLVTAIREQRLDSVEAIGRALRAGTNCGSCIPELKGLLGHVHQPDKQLALA